MTKTTNQKKPAKTAKTKTPRKKKVAKTDELVAKVVYLRSQMVPFSDIGRSLNIDRSTARRWFNETTSKPKEADIPDLRAEQVAMREGLIRGLMEDLRAVSDPVSPDYAAYEGNLLARAKAYDSWLVSKDKVLGKKLKIVAAIDKELAAIAKLNGLDSPSRVEWKDTTEVSDVDAQIIGLLMEMEEAAKEKEGSEVTSEHT